MTKSFLKWAGGKRQSLHMIIKISGYFTGRFIEPFVGSGVVSLNVPAEGYIIADLNEDLINVYKILKLDTNFIDDLRTYFTKANNTPEVYYELRDRFNSSTDIKEKALLFVYLNRHCFNGLCRYNKSGKFNVPFGRYNEVYFPEESLRQFGTKLEKCEIYCQGFEKTMSFAKADDVIYCDPPYLPFGDDNSFTDYSTEGFNLDQHKRLAELAESAPCKCLISNHNSDVARELYCNADNIITQDISRHISAATGSRVAVTELLAFYDNTASNGVDPQGHKATTSGARLENIVADTLTECGCLAVRYKELNDDHFEMLKLNEITGLLVKRVPYINVFESQSYGEFVLYTSEDVAIRIECRRQHSGGSVDEKIPCLIENIKCFEEQEVIVVLDGNGMRPATKRYLHNRVKEIEDKNVQVYTLNQFKQWAMDTFGNDCPKFSSEQFKLKLTKRNEAVIADVEMYPVPVKEYIWTVEGINRSIKYFIPDLNGTDNFQISLSTSESVLYLDKLEVAVDKIATVTCIAKDANGAETSSTIRLK